MEASDVRDQKAREGGGSQLRDVLPSIPVLDVVDRATRDAEQGSDLYGSNAVTAQATNCNDIYRFQFGRFGSFPMRKQPVEDCVLSIGLRGDVLKVRDPVVQTIAVLVVHLQALRPRADEGRS